ncbi:hypothetical protein N9L68_00790 [bacterium]|nr:hypothetical protein [bacterium]
MRPDGQIHAARAANRDEGREESLDQPCFRLHTLVDQFRPKEIRTGTGAADQLFGVEVQQNVSDYSPC